MLRVDALLTTTQPGNLAALFKLLNYRFHNAPRNP